MPADGVRDPVLNADVGFGQEVARVSFAVDVKALPVRVGFADEGRELFKRRPDESGFGHARGKGVAPGLSLGCETAPVYAKCRACLRVWGRLHYYRLR